MESVDSIYDSVNVVVVIVAILAATFVLIARRSVLARDLKALYLAVLAFATMWLVLFSANLWVSLNEFVYRYYFPLYAAVFLLVAGATTEATALVRRWAASEDGTGRR